MPVHWYNYHKVHEPILALSLTTRDPRLTINEDRQGRNDFNTAIQRNIVLVSLHFPYNG